MSISSPEAKLFIFCHSMHSSKGNICFRYITAHKQVKQTIETANITDDTLAAITFSIMRLCHRCCEQIICSVHFSKINTILWCLVRRKEITRFWLLCQTWQSHQKMAYTKLQSWSNAHKRCSHDCWCIREESKWYSTKNYYMASR